METEEPRGIIVKCYNCGYQGIRWNNNLICRKCKGLIKIIAKQV